ncbi:unnamed protein product [Prunus armeniaca]
MCQALLSQKNESGETALHIAAGHGRADIVELLIQTAKARRCEDLEQGAATFTLSSSSEEEAAYWKIFIRTPSKEKDTALHEAVRFKHLGVVEILIREDLDFSYPPNVAGETPLYLASERRYKALFSEILRTCKHPTYQGPNGRTALHAAVIYGDEGREILNKKTDLAIVTDEKGWTPLHYAASYDHASIVIQLLETDKCSAYMGDEADKKTALHIAASKGHVNVMKQLISYCPDCCKVVDQRRRNALHYALEKSQSRIIDFVMKDTWLSNVLLNAKDDDGNTPLHLLNAPIYNQIPFITDARVDKMAFNKEHMNALDVIKANDNVKYKIKVVRSDRGGEYYGKFDQTGRHPGPFAKYLQECGIVAQYTNPGTPEQNGVAERRNRTLKDMVRSMICNSQLPNYLWGEAIRTENYILNRVPSKEVSKTPFELWTNRKPSLNHLHIWGCKAEAKVFNPQEKKLDPKTISCFFVGYPEKTKGYRFYCPNHTTRLVETGRAVFLENVHEERKATDFVFEELGEIAIEPAKQSVQVPHISEMQGEDYEDMEPEQEDMNEIQVQETQDVNNEVVQPQEAPAPQRRSNRNRRPAISQDYVVYLQESEFMASDFEDPLFFNEAINSPEVLKWKEAMESELDSMENNQVWDLVELPEGVKPIGCKWVFKTKKDSMGNIERFKARLVAKGFTQKEGIDYSETFSPVSTKDAFRIIMALTAQYDLFLHQMDVKTTFLNGRLDEEIYMVQPEGFIKEGEEHLVCKLKKSIYGLNQASRQWYLRFDEVVSSQGFTENPVDECIYLKFSGSNFIFLVLYVDDILLATNNLSMLADTKFFLSSHFEMKDMGEASYVLGVEIHRDRSRGMLGLSQKGYIERVLKRFNMLSYASGEVPITKGDKLSRAQSPQNELEKEEMKNRPYASLVGSLMYAQVCTRPDIAFAISVLGRFQANPRNAHWIAAKKDMRYFQRTKSFMLVYQRQESLELVGYCDSDFAGCPDDLKSTSAFVFLLARGAVSWKSSKQSTVAASTMQAEFVACYEATIQASWLKNFITGLCVVDSIARPVQIFCDNSATVFYSRNNKRSAGTKHLEIKFLLVREKIKQGQTRIDHISTHDMIADPLNKAIPNSIFKRHVTSMGILASFDDAE